MRQENVLGKHNLVSGVGRRRSCSGVTHGCANRSRLWPPRRDDSSGTLIGAGGTRRCDWPESALADNACRDFLQTLNVTD